MFTLHLWFWIWIYFPQKQVLWWSIDENVTNKKREFRIILQLESFLYTKNVSFWLLRQFNQFHEFGRKRNIVKWSNGNDTSVSRISMVKCKATIYSLAYSLMLELEQWFPWREQIFGRKVIYQVHIQFDIKHLKVVQ